jgi:formamidopyrimidine-DNA glycosylase
MARKPPARLLIKSAEIREICGCSLWTRPISDCGCRISERKEVMPELAEVEFFRKQWDPGMGHNIIEVDLHQRKRIFRGSDPREIVRRLTGEKLLRSSARGKQMLFEFSANGRDMVGSRKNVRSWIGIHLGMTGKLWTAPADFRPQKHDHLALRQARRVLVFSDARLFGRVRFHHGPDQPDWWKSDVPEIVSRRFNQQFLEQFLRRHRNAPIKAVLLMQKGFSGVGNWMADEILWRTNILPARLTATLSADEKKILLRETKLVARVSFRTLAKDFSDPPQAWLIHQKWKREGICPRHRTLLSHGIVGGRSTVWCGRCQR